MSLNLVEARQLAQRDKLNSDIATLVLVAIFSAEAIGLEAIGKFFTIAMLTSIHNSTGRPTLTNLLVPPSTAAGVQKTNMGFWCPQLICTAVQSGMKKVQGMEQRNRPKTWLR